MSVSCLDSTDWVADFLSRDSYAVCSCAAVRKTSLLVLAVPWRQRPAQTQSMSEIYLKNMHPFICQYCQKSMLLSSQGYERVRRVSEDDNSTTPSYEEDEEEGLDEMTSREALPKEVRDPAAIHSLELAFERYFMQFEDCNVYSLLP